MSPEATERQVVSAVVSLRVPRGVAGDLESGVVDVLERVDGVEHVELDRVASIRPNWTDVYVDAEVVLGLVAEGATRSASDAAAVAMLEDGFGVTGVVELSVLDADEHFETARGDDE